VQVEDALLLYALSTVLLTAFGILVDLLNARRGQPWYAFPSKRMYRVSFVLIVIEYTVAFWLAFVIGRHLTSG
jgi:hypothetical protein